MELISWLEELDAHDLARAGGKGANLGAMVRAGFPVPAGFVVLTPAYRAFVEANGIGAEIARLAARASDQDPASLDAASGAIRSLFEQGALDPDLTSEITKAYEQLGRGRVAVRSSATAEDLPGASFAGQQESYLNVEGERPLLDAVVRCWSSLWTARALSYRGRQGSADPDLALAVVIQRLVPADAAGVLFSANPVNGRRDQIVIDAVFGLGEALVGGQVTPDHWLVDSASGRTLQRQIAPKQLMTIRSEGGTETSAVPEELREASVLDEDGVGTLVDLGGRLQEHFGAPQNVEWARDDGRFWLVQTRPITSLFPLPSPEAAVDGPLRVYVCLNLLQGLLEPLTPSGVDFLGRLGRGPAALLGVALEPGDPPPVFKVAAGRVYLDATAALEHPQGRRFVLAATSFLDQPTSKILELLLEREGARLTPERAALPVHPRPWLPLTIFARAVAALIAPDRSRRRALARAEQVIVELEREATSAHGVEGKRRFLMDTPPRLFRGIALRLGPVAGPGLALRFLVERKLEQWLGDASRLQAVLRSLPHNPTTEMDLELWRISRSILAEGVEPSREHPAVRDFLAAYGHRGIREIDLGVARWRDDPAYVLEVLRTYLEKGETGDAEAHFRAGGEEAERACAELVSEVRREKGALRALVLRFALSRIRATVGMREYPKFFFVRAVAVARRVLAELGNELVAAGELDDADDVFFLRFGNERGDLRRISAENRAEYERELVRRSVPRVITSTGEAFVTAPARSDGALEGTSASVGVYEGRVRVIHDPRGARLEPGEVLVAPGTDPAWTPLFLVAGALVMEIGGIMSHGSVVAREYGIPAVVGVPDATSRLRTGQRVRVDGEAGTVAPLDG